MPSVVVIEEKYVAQILYVVETWKLTLDKKMDVWNSSTSTWVKILLMSKSTSKIFNYS